MIEIKYNNRTFINARNQIVVRVRWNKKKSEVGFSTGMCADPLKWNSETQRPLRGSTHIIGKEKIPSRIINNRIDEFLEAIENAFGEYALHNQVPTPSELKELVNELIGRNKSEVAEDNEENEKPLEDIFKKFLRVGSLERNWTEKVHYKYEQIWKQLTKCDPKVSLETLDKNKMIELKDWFVKNGYRNRTITKQFRILKSFLRWMKANSYPVQDSAIEYQPHLTVTKRNVTYLTYI